MKRLLSKITPVRLGIGIGALVSVAAGFVYIVIWQERGAAFYPFAALAFIGGSLSGGIVAAVKARERRGRAFFVSSSAVFGLACLLFVLMYAVLPQFQRTSIDLTAFRDGVEGQLAVPPHLRYTLPDGSTGILVASDEFTAVVAVIGDQPPFPSTVFVINKSEGRTLGSLPFRNDVIAATIDDGTLYIYNDKLGYLLNARTGEVEDDFLLIDNYGGLSESDRPFFSMPSTGRWYMETTAVISSWSVDGTVRSRRHLTFNSIALACFIRGDTLEVTRLRRPRQVLVGERN